MSIATDTLEAIIGHLTGPKRDHEDQTAFVIRMVRLDTIHMALQDVRNAEAKPAYLYTNPSCSAVLREQGKPYPRTCPVHGPGPCPTL